jgi:5'-3' exonuclease
MSYLLIDGNSVGHAAQRGGKLTAGDMEVQALFGFIRSMRATIENNPGFRPVVLWDGRSWRYEVFETYKDKRGIDPQQVKDKEAYKLQTPYIRKAMEALGVTQLMSLNMEADDLAGILVEKMRDGRHPVKLITGDQDWLQLVRPGVMWMDHRKDREVTHVTFEEFTGFTNSITFLQGKALLGDQSDSIGGVEGIGAKSAPIVLQEYGSVPNMLKTIGAQIEAGADKKKIDLPKSLSRYRQKIYNFCTPGSEGREIFKRNMMLMNLIKAVPERPTPEPMQRTPGKFDKEAFAQLCEEFNFLSILRDLDTFCIPFEKRAQNV